MKSTFTAARVAGIAAVFLGLFVGSASAGNDPIPKVAIRVQKKPGGTPIQATTDSAGKFAVDNLEAGNYALTFKLPPPQTKQIISTTRSNIKHQSIVTDGVEELTLSVELGVGTTSVEVEITKDTGNIHGTVTHAAASNQRSMEDPIPGVDMKLGRNPGGIMIHTKTDKDGNFVFENLAAGQYELTVNRPQTPTTTKGSTGQRARHEISKSCIRNMKSVTNGVEVVTVDVELGAGRASAEIEITGANGKITGKVNDDANSAMGGVSTTRQSAPNATTPSTDTPKATPEPKAKNKKSKKATSAE